MYVWTYADCSYMNLSLLCNNVEPGNILVLEFTITFLKGKRNMRKPWVLNPDTEV
jgi:hypothetical protein